MPISRGQMNRQLYGVGSLVGREKFGIGSKLKKFVRKIIPNEVADVAVKAAPFVAPFNPALGGAMAGLGSFDQTGSISRGVKSGLLNYGLGQGARYLGGADFQGNPFEGKLFSSPLGTETGIGKFLDQRKAAKAGVDLKNAKSFDIDQYSGIEEMLADTDPSKLSIAQRGDIVAQNLGNESATKGLLKQVIDPNATFAERSKAITDLGGKALKTVYTDKEGNIDKLAVGATIAGGVSYFDAKRLAKEAELVGDEDEYTEEMYEADKDRYSKYYADIITPAAFGLKEGGRVKYQSGAFGVPSITLDEKEEAKTLKEILREMDEEKISILNPIKAFIKKAGEENGLDVEALNETLRKYPNAVNELTDFEPGIFEPGEPTDQGPYPMDDKTQEEKEAEMLYELEQELNSKADGGRIGFFEGNDDPSDPKFSPQKRKGIISINPMQDDTDELLTGGGGIGGILSPFTRAEKSFLFKTLAKQGGSDRTFTMPNLYKIFKNPGKFKKDEAALKAFLKIKMGKKEGGRIGYAEGTEKPLEPINIGIGTFNPQRVVELYEKAKNIPKNISLEDISLEDIKGIPKRLMEGTKSSISSMVEPLGNEYRAYMEFFSLPEKDKKKMEEMGLGIFDVFEYLAMRDNKAQGGRIELAMGSEVPVRKNRGGITELDYRNTGGFVPVGIKEKADDVPAMLSKNEFVMTADAVRGIGNGDVETGAQKLYNIMKQAEKQGIA